MTQYQYDGSDECVILCPTRENAEGALNMVISACKTAHRLGTEIVLVIDEDEPQAAAYKAIPSQIGDLYHVPVTVMTVPGGSLTKATNEAVERMWDSDAIVGHVGDDHRFITPGWDNAIRDAIHDGALVAYAYDGFRAAWASAWWTPMRVIRTLGWLAVPGSMHLTIDDVFMDIGAGLGRLKFLPKVLIEHLHPAGGKVEWRPIVKAHYSRDKRVREEENLYRYRRDHFADDIHKLQLEYGLPVQPVTDLSPGATFRRNLKGKWALTSSTVQKVWPTDAELIEWAGRAPRSTPDYLKMRRAWSREHR